MKTSKSIFSYLILPTIMLSFFWGCLIAYQTLKAPIEKIFLIVGVIIFGCPLVVTCFNYMFYSYIKTWKTNGLRNKRMDQKHLNQDKVNTTVQKYKIVPEFELKKLSTIKANKITKTNQPVDKIYKSREVTSEGYLLLKESFQKALDSHLLNKYKITLFKCEVDYRLKDYKYHYNENSFKNDFHEIYSKIKARVLSEEDYIFLTYTLEEIINMN